MLPKLSLQPEVFWTVIFIATMVWHGIVRVYCGKLYRNRCVEKELIAGGFFATSLATGIAFHNHVPVLPLDFSAVSNVEALGWIVLFWTVSTFLIFSRPLAKVLRLD